jgi:HEAT repeat protein
MRSRVSVPCLLASAITLSLLPALLGPVCAGEPAKPRAAQPKDSKPSLLPQKPPLAYRAVSGERLVYELDYSSNGEADLRVLFQGQKAATTQEDQASTLAYSMTASLRGEMTTTVLEKGDDRVLALYSVKNPAVHVLSGGQELAGQSQTIQKDFMQDFLVELNPQGKVISVWFDKDIERTSKDFALTLLALTQFVLPSGQAGAADTWTTGEENRTGRYLAHYQVLKGSPKGTPAAPQAESPGFRKTIIRYLPEVEKTEPGKFQTPKKVEPSGSLLVRFDVAAGHLLSVSGSQSEITLMSGKQVARTEATFRMSYLRTETLSEAELTGLREAGLGRQKLVPATPLFLKRSKEEIEANIQRTELGVATLQSLLADLAKAEIAHETNETPLYLKFKALVYVHPEACDRLGKILASAPPKGMTTRILTGALGTVGNPQAQAALSYAILARPNDWPAVSTLIPALGGAASPTVVTEKTLRDLATRATDPNVAATATLALGTVAHNLANKSPNRSAAVLDWLIERTKTPASEDQTRLLLLAIGNAGAARSFPVVARFTTDASPLVRAAALVALRFVKSSQSDSLLLHALASDADPKVRRDAAFALSFRKMTSASFAAQKNALATDQDPKVREALLGNLWKARETFLEAQKLVEDAAQNDPSEDVRREASQLLKSTP